MIDRSHTVLARLLRRYIHQGEWTQLVDTKSDGTPRNGTLLRLDGSLEITDREAEVLRRVFIEET